MNHKKELLRGLWVKYNALTIRVAQRKQVLGTDCQSQSGSHLYTRSLRDKGHKSDKGFFQGSRLSKIAQP